MSNNINYLHSDLFDLQDETELVFGLMGTLGYKQRRSMSSNNYDIFHKTYHIAVSCSCSIHLCTNHSQTILEQKSQATTCEL